MSFSLLRFFWFIPAVAVIGALAVLWLAHIGLPHFAFSYTFEDPGTQRFQDRYFLSCTYVGPFGAWTERAVDGWCPWWRWRTRNAIS